MSALRRGGAMLAALVGLGLLLGACAGGEDISAPRGPESATITGVITEFEDDDLSVRADDGRQLIFWVGEPPVPLEDLRAYYRQRTPLEITYEARSSRLVPTSIEVAGRPATP